MKQRERKRRLSHLDPLGHTLAMLEYVLDHERAEVAKWLKAGRAPSEIEARIAASFWLIARRAGYVREAAVRERGRPFLTDPVLLRCRCARLEAHLPTVGGVGSRCDAVGLFPACLTAGAKYRSSHSVSGRLRPSQVPYLLAASMAALSLSNRASCSAGSAGSSTSWSIWSRTSRSDAMTGRASFTSMGYASGKSRVTL